MVLPFVSLVQSVDSKRLLDAINAWGAADDRKIKVLLEPHVAAEESKQGFSPEEILEILSAAESYENVIFCGIMGMATFTDDQTVIRSDFATLRSIFDECRNLSEILATDFKELSIGMSDDYPIAVEYGSTMVRIGSMIFESRQ